MPIVESIAVKSGKIIHWVTTESADELMALCAEFGIDAVTPDYIESRRKQILVMRLLHFHANPGTTLKYTREGKPYLDSDKHISYSHCGEHVVIMTASYACGVDIEQIHDRIGKVTRKFLSDSELSEHRNSDHGILIRMWSAKEAMFKVYGKDTVFLRSNIFVTIIDPVSASAELHDGTLVLKRRILFKPIEDMILAWTETHED